MRNHFRYELAQLALNRALDIRGILRHHPDSTKRQLKAADRMVKAAQDLLDELTYAR